MKNIYKAKDDLYYQLNITDSQNQVLLPSDLHTFTMQFYTQNNGDYVEYNSSDLVDNVLRINALDLTGLADGPLRVRFLIGLNDSNYADNSFDITCERLTGYFLKTAKTKNDTQGGE